MKKNLYFPLILILAVILLSGCVPEISPPVETPIIDKASVESTEEAAPKVLLKIISFGYDSDDPNNLVTVVWEAEGIFPEGFILTWSNDISYPEPGINSWAPVPDGSIREVQVTLENKKEHYFRICQVVDAVCKEYSAPVLVEFPAVSKTSEQENAAATLSAKTKTAAETSTPSASGLSITEIITDEQGVVHVNWQLDDSAPEGFKVIWSGQNQNPVYPGDEAQRVSDPAQRSLAIEGFKHEIEYYFRVCVFTGGECVSYSPSVAYFVPVKSTATPKPNSTPSEAPGSLVLTSIAKKGDGKVTVNWSATGSFPKGFKIAYSSHNTSPVYPGDEYVYVSDQNARSATVSGLRENETYYFRLCKYNGSGCDFYSNMKSYTVPAYTATKTASPTADGSTINLIPLVDQGGGSVQVHWIPVGNFSKGFKVVWSDVTTAPVFPGNDYVYVSDPGATTTIVSGLTAGETFYFRVCRYTGGGCDVYSNMQQIEVPLPTSTPTATSTQTKTPTLTLTPTPTLTPEP
ncbi:MAG: fibronectin type III domain-containing protein [Anaerolineaceae bacterium]|nr:fibronectin type III domain-containing protein [Anaerolineaceae bacterium]